MGPILPGTHPAPEIMEWLGRDLQRPFSPAVSRDNFTQTRLLSAPFKNGFYLEDISEIIHPHTFSQRYYLPFEHQVRQNNFCSIPPPFHDVFIKFNNKFLFEMILVKNITEFQTLL